MVLLLPRHEFNPHTNLSNPTPLPACVSGGDATPERDAAGPARFSQPKQRLPARLTCCHGPPLPPACLLSSLPVEDAVSSPSHALLPRALPQPELAVCQPPTAQAGCPKSVSKAGCRLAGMLHSEGATASSSGMLLVLAEVQIASSWCLEVTEARSKHAGGGAASRAASARRGVLAGGALLAAGGALQSVAGAPPCVDHSPSNGACASKVSPASLAVRQLQVVAHVSMSA